MTTPTPEQIMAAVVDYATGNEPIKAIAARHNIGRNRLADAIKTAGVNRKTGPTHPPEVRAAAIADHQNGMYLNAISKKHGVGRHVIRGWLGEAGMDDPVALTGGRWVRDGLVSRWQYDGAA